MSTTNTEQLKLYKNTYLYNGSRYKFYHDSRDYDTWLADNSADTPYSETVNYKSISEPIPIHKYIDECDAYTYGSITNHGKTYYFFVDNITTDAYGLTTINYTVDWWATNWAKITCTKAHVSRYSGSKPGYMAQPFTPFLSTYTKLEELKSGKTGITQTVKNGMFVFSYFTNVIVDGKPVPDEMHYGAFDITATSIQAVMEGTWQESINMADGDILGIFIVPLFTTADLSDWVPSPAPLVFSYKTFDISNGSSVPVTMVYNTPITSTEQEVQGIMDWYGTNVWQCPIDTTISSFVVTMELSVTSCLLRFAPNTDGELGCEMTGKGFTYQCRQATLFIDKGSEYTWRDQRYDKENQALQSLKQEWQALASTAENVGFGAAFGGGVGGVASGVGGIIEFAGTYMINKEFDPKILANTLQHYRDMQDTMSVVGDSISRLWYNIDLNETAAPLIKYKLTMDTPTKDRMNADINTNGYYCDEVTSNLTSYFGKDKVIVADNIVVEGACNVIGKQQVVARLQNGVEFI